LCVCVSRVEGGGGEEVCSFYLKGE
jgi:hypothetical protein